MRHTQAFGNLSAPYLHLVYTLPAPCLHLVSTLSAPYLHPMCTLSATCLHPVYILSAPCSRPVWALSVRTCRRIGDSAYAGPIARAMVLSRPCLGVSHSGWATFRLAVSGGDGRSHTWVHRQHPRTVCLSPLSVATSRVVICRGNSVTLICSRSCGHGYLFSPGLWWIRPRSRRQKNPF